MQPHEYIHKFCANPENEIRLHLTKPARLHDQLIASNGNILIVTGADPLVECCEDNKLIGASHKIRNHYHRMLYEHEESFHPIHDLALPEPVLCPTCNGRGSFHECAHCDGNGDEPGFEHLSWPPDCSKCGGVGYFTTDAEPQVTCFDCDGYKFMRTQVFPVFDGLFSRRYIALLQTLPKIKLATNPENPLKGIAFFNFSGGYGALMPCRA